MAKNHFVPNLIIRNFSINDENGIPRISFLQKSTNQIIENILSRKQCQERYFYSKEKISDLLSKFNHIILNPIFKDKEKTLEYNLDINLESEFGKICQELKKYPQINDLIKNQEFIKEYLVVQFLRSKKFKESIKETRIIKDYQNKFALEIINKRVRDDFFSCYNLTNTNIFLLQNDTNTPFVLSDLGVLVTELIKNNPDGSKTKGNEFYLSIDPKLIILFSQKKLI